MIDLIFVCELQAAFTFAILPGENRVPLFLCPLMPSGAHDFQPEALADLTDGFAPVHQLLVFLELQHFSRLVEDALQQIALLRDCVDDEHGAMFGDHEQDCRSVWRWSILAFNGCIPALVQFRS